MDVETKKQVEAKKTDSARYLGTVYGLLVGSGPPFRTNKHQASPSGRYPFRARNGGALEGAYRHMCDGWESGMGDFCFARKRGLHGDLNFFAR